MLLGQIFALTQTTLLKKLFVPSAAHMHPSQRDPRPSYSYDEQTQQSTAYTCQHVSHHSEEYPPGGYQQYDGTHYYAAPTHTMGGVNNCVSSPLPFFFVLTDQP